MINDNSNQPMPSASDPSSTEVGALQQELDRLQSRLQQLECQRQQLLQVSPNLIWIADPDGRGIEFNSRWLVYTGMALTDCLGEGFMQAIAASDRNPFLQRWQQAQLGQTGFSMSYRLRQADGTYHLVFLQVNPLLSDSGQLQGWLGIQPYPRAAAVPADPAAFRPEASPDASENLEITERLSLSTAHPQQSPNPPPLSIDYDPNQMDHLAGKSKLSARDFSPEGAREFELLRTLQQLTHSLNQHLADLPDLLQTMLGLARDAIPAAQFGMIVLQQPQDELLELTAAIGMNWQVLQSSQPFRPGDGVLGQVFLSGEPCLLQGEPMQLELLDQLPAAIWAVPIQTPAIGQLGVMAIGNWQNSAAFSPADCKLLETFGEQAAIAIHNAQIIQRLEVSEHQLALRNEQLAERNFRLGEQRQRIQLQNQQLQDTARLKSQFLAVVSHELRTPLNAVIGFSQLLLRQQQYQLDPPQVDMMQRILSNGRQLLVLVNDILDLSKLEAGYLELKSETFNLGHLINMVVEELRSLATAKGLTVNVQVHLSNPRVTNDIVRLRQVLINLISNAIKFTETGGVYITLEEIGGDRLLITIYDTGIGMSETDLQHIFEGFRQVEQSTTRRYAGTGLGLAIAHWLVSLMQGTITVHSQLGEGSTFCIELPRLLPDN